jgi:RPA family protein
MAFASDIGDIKEGDFVFVYGRVRVSKRGRGVVSVSKIVPLDTTEIGELMDYYLVELIEQLDNALREYSIKKDMTAKKGKQHYGDQYSKYRELCRSIKQQLMDRYNIEDEIPLPEEEEELPELS